MAILSSSSLTGDNVVNLLGEDLGSIKDLMVDTDSGKVTYAVLEFGTILGLGGKLFAVPLNAMQLDMANKRFIFDQDKEALQNAPGFNEDSWPDFADREWEASIHSHYKTSPYWEQ